MDATTLLAQLFPLHRDIAFDGVYFAGVGTNGNTAVHVIGTIDKAAIGVELAHRIAAE